MRVGSVTGARSWRIDNADMDMSQDKVPREERQMRAEEAKERREAAERSELPMWKSDEAV